MTISLHPISFECLREPELLTLVMQKAGHANPHQVFTGENLPRKNRIEDVRQHPENIKWYYRYIVYDSRNVVVGSVSFHGAPDERGMVEIGIGIAEAERGNGFAKVALKQMWDWAITQDGVKYLRYTVSPDNAPSIAIIRGFGFPEIGVQIDEEDGPELIFEISKAEYLKLK